MPTSYQSPFHTLWLTKSPTCTGRMVSCAPRSIRRQSTGRGGHGDRRSKTRSKVAATNSIEACVTSMLSIPLYTLLTQTRDCLENWIERLKIGRFASDRRMTELASSQIAWCHEWKETLELSCLESKEKMGHPSPSGIEAGKTRSFPASDQRGIHWDRSNTCTAADSWVLKLLGLQSCPVSWTHAQFSPR